MQPTTSDGMAHGLVQYWALGNWCQLPQRGAAPCARAAHRGREVEAVCDIAAKVAAPFACQLPAARSLAKPPITDTRSPETHGFEKLMAGPKADGPRGSSLDERQVALC